MSPTSSTMIGEHRREDRPLDADLGQSHGAAPLRVALGRRGRIGLADCGPVAGAFGSARARRRAASRRRRSRSVLRRRGRPGPRPCLRGAGRSRSSGAGPGHRPPCRRTCRRRAARSTPPESRGASRTSLVSRRTRANMPGRSLPWRWEPGADHDGAPVRVDERVDRDRPSGPGPVGEGVDRDLQHLARPSPARGRPRECGNRPSADRSPRGSRVLAFLHVVAHAHGAQADDAAEGRTISVFARRAAASSASAWATLRVFSASSLAWPEMKPLARRSIEALVLRARQREVRSGALEVRLLDRVVEPPSSVPRVTRSPSWKGICWIRRRSRGARPPSLRNAGCRPP